MGTELSQIITELIKRGVEFNYNNNILWFYESQLMKLPQDERGYYLPYSEDSGHSIYRIFDNDLNFRNIFPDIMADINNKLQPCLTLAELVERRNENPKLQVLMDEVSKTAKDAIKYITNLN